MDVIDLSKNIIAYAGAKGYRVTNLKLQKTLYYVQGYYLARYNRPLFDDEIVNWAYGPVVPEAYFRFCSYGASPIDAEDIRDVFAGLGFDETALICRVVNVCLSLTARQLVEHTHAEEPWLRTNRNQIIDTMSIKTFFSAHDPLGVR